MMAKKISDYEGNESVAKGGDNSKNDSSRTVYVDIPWYQFQKMNVNQLKEKLKKRKTSVWYKKILDEILLTALKENYQLYVDGAGLTKESTK